VVHPREDNIANQVDNAFSFHPQHLPQPLWKRADLPYNVHMLEGDIPLASGWDRRGLEAQCFQRWPHLNRKAPEHPDGLSHHCVGLDPGDGGRCFILEGLLRLLHDESDACIVMAGV
jgi:hypothetical protein